MENLETFWNVLLAIAASIVTLGGAGAIIAGFVRPYKKLAERVGKLEQRQACDHTEIGTIEKGIEKLCKCTLALTDHELTGNSVDKLRKAKDEMQNFLIEK